MCIVLPKVITKVFRRSVSLHGSGMEHGGSLSLPRTGLIFYAKAPGMVDSIGLSIAEFWAACPVEHRPLYSADGSAFYDTGTIIANIEASEYLNDGGELIGNSILGYAQYEDGTSVAILNKALKYFKINTEMLDALELLDSLVIIGV